jgi:phosphoribosylaminoimidazole-succinocarboxamide synthase
MISGDPLFESDIPTLPLLARGKVRDIYSVDDQRLLIVTTDRLSAYDVVLPDPVPGKGAVLTQLSNFWFAMMQDIVPNHLTGQSLESLIPNPEFRQPLINRSIIVRRLNPLPIEAVVRGYLIGSGWRDYQSTGAVCGIELPEGLASRVRDLSIAIYERAAAFALQRGIIIADTKFEFGLDDEGELYIIDEVLTPDSSRFWPQDQYKVGISPPSFDKQFVRDYLDTLNWDKTPPGPELPADVLQKTSEKYREALDILTSQ